MLVKYDEDHFTRIRIRIHIQFATIYFSKINDLWGCKSSESHTQIGWMMGSTAAAGGNRWYKNVELRPLPEVCTWECVWDEAQCSCIKRSHSMRHVLNNTAYCVWKDYDFLVWQLFFKCLPLSDRCLPLQQYMRGNSWLFKAVFARLLLLLDSSLSNR